MLRNILFPGYISYTALEQKLGVAEFTGDSCWEYKCLSRILRKVSFSRLPKSWQTPRDILVKPTHPNHCLGKWPSNAFPPLAWLFHFSLQLRKGSECSMGSVLQFERV